MTELFSKKIISYLIKKRIIIQDEDVYLYGCNAILYTIISTICLLFISIIFGRLRQGCVYIGILYLNQSIGGGYHANKHWKCLFAMAVGLLVGFGLGEGMQHYMILIYIYIPASAVLLFIPLVLHPNLQHLEVSRDRMKQRSKVVTITEMIICTLILLSDYVWLTVSISSAITICAISRIAGYILYKRSRVSGQQTTPTK